ncbi:MAG TPA: energy transducer TonB [Candidatus Angelobacter sp.]|jgi:TonB family protein|nr:energy transducer TonB [Candidatus Angelobacter sp.]
MSNISVYDELDQAIDQMLQPQLASPSFPQRARNGWGPQKRRDPGAPSQTDKGNIRELVELAADLRDLPRANFKSRLKLELEWEAAGRTVSATDSDRQAARGVAPASGEILPSLFGKTWAGYPVRRINFAFSVALHGVMAFLVGASFLMVKSYVPRAATVGSVTVRLEPYPVPIGSHPSSGGGSGGAADKMRASVGVAPPAAREQLTPPIVMRSMSQPRLAAAATVIAPPDLAVPRTQQIGDPLSALTAPSNGPGVAGGIGGSVGGGVGGDRGGFGRGPGSGSGCCGDVFGVGNGVSMPRAIYAPEPEFSEEARIAKFQGEVTLLVTIGTDGRARNLTVVRSVGMGLDQKAIDAVRTWRFDPAKKNGRPVAVQMNIIVNFHLF